MTETNYIKNYKTDHSRFGGMIYQGDFDAYHSLTDIAARIISDRKFDEMCRKNLKNKNIERR